MSYFHEPATQYHYLTPTEFLRCTECECALTDHDDVGQCGCCDCGWITNEKGEFIDRYLQRDSEN